VITKGLASVKYMGDKVSEELYNMSVKKEYKRFTDVLLDIEHETSVDSRQFEILVKLDFFSRFGNQRELLLIRDVFDMFKGGDAKKISRDKVDGTQFEEVVRRHSTWVNKNGTESKSYTLLRPLEVIKEMEDVILSMGIEDMTPEVRARNFFEIMGYAGYITGNEEDRRKLFVTAVFPVKRKKDGMLFGYNLVTQSIGSGKESRLTVFKNKYGYKKYDSDPIKEGDIILLKKYERNGAYFNLVDYVIL